MASTINHDYWFINKLEALSLDAPFSGQLSQAYFLNAAMASFA